MADMYPFAEGFQLKILAMMARDKAFYTTFKEILKPKYFREDVHIDVARMIHEHYDREHQRARDKKTEINAPTLHVLWEEMKKLVVPNKVKNAIRHDYENCLLDIMEAELTDAEYIKESVIEFGRRSAMEHAILESAEDIGKGNPDYPKIEDRIKEAVRVGEDIGDLGVDYFEEAEERTARYEQGIDGVERVPTGLIGLDKVLKGGLGRGELGVIIAPPNRGKSFGLTNIGAGAVLEGYNVAHFTGEMPEKQVTKRYDNRFTGKDFQYMKENRSKVLTAIMNIQKHRKGRLFVKKFRTSQTTVDTLRSYLTRLRIEKGFKPDVIIVDYADLLQPRRNYSDRRFELESIYLDLRDLADEFNCVIWTASQTNRGGLDKKVITIGDLAEAFNKANIADAMVALCQTVEEKQEGTMRWHVAKHRDGEANITLDGEIDYPTANMVVHPLEV